VEERDRNSSTASGSPGTYISHPSCPPGAPSKRRPWRSLAAESSARQRSLLVAVLCAKDSLASHVHRLEGGPGTTGYHWPDTTPTSAGPSRRERRRPFSVRSIACGCRSTPRLRGRTGRMRSLRAFGRVLLLGRLDHRRLLGRGALHIAIGTGGPLNSRREGRFEVINGGTAGYSTDQEYSSTSRGRPL